MIIKKNRNEVPRAPGRDKSLAKKAREDLLKEKDQKKPAKK